MKELEWSELFKLLTEPKPRFLLTQIQTVEKDSVKLIWKGTLLYQDYQSPYNLKEDFLENAQQILFDLKLKRAKDEINDNYLKTYLDELVIIYNAFQPINLNNVEFIYQTTARYDVDVMYDGKGGTFKLEDLKPEHLKTFMDFNKYKYQAVVLFKEGIEEIISNSVSEIPETQKLELKLSVADIALLFRLLDEENLIQYKHRSEIYRFISSSFKTELMDSISAASVKNKFLSPDTSAIDKLDPLLVNLRIKLKNIIK